MKTITFAIAALMMSALTACSSSPYSADSAHRDASSSSLSGSSSAAVPAGNTMNDHDKMLEMCRSMRTTKSCDDIMKECQGQSNPHSCVRSYMK